MIWLYKLWNSCYIKSNILMCASLSGISRYKG